jgi:hypothetical protein
MAMPIKQYGSLPQELLDRIIKDAMPSQRLRWRPAESLRSVVEEPFKWPSSIPTAQFEILRHAEGLILLENANIGLPTRHRLQGNSMVLDIPNALKGNEECVRYLVLDVQLEDRNAISQRELNRTLRSMGAMETTFSGLKTYVLSLFVRNRRAWRTDLSFLSC